MNLYQYHFIAISIDSRTTLQYNEKRGRIRNDLIKTIKLTNFVIKHKKRVEMRHAHCTLNIILQKIQTLGKRRRSGVLQEGVYRQGRYTSKIGPAPTSIHAIIFPVETMVEML